MRTEYGYRLFPISSDEWTDWNYSPLTPDELAEVLSFLDAAERFAGDLPEPSTPGPVTR